MTVEKNLTVRALGHQPSANYFLSLGFTLLELLVTIALIAILAGLLLPAFARVKSKSLETVCRSNLRQLGIAFHLYLQDNRDIFPLAPTGTSVHTDQWIYFGEDWKDFQGAISGKTTVDSPILQSTGAPQTNLLVCPANVFLRGSVSNRLSRDQLYPFSYTLSSGNARFLEKRKFGMASEIIEHTLIRNPFRFHMIRNPAGKIMLAEEKTMAEGKPTFASTEDASSSGWMWSFHDRLTQLHRGKGLTVMGDSHVEKLKPEIAITPEYCDPLF